ncbi:MAG: GntR family transcriptional regulator [Clostridia bacterium]|nr:GntR family transcriptional regulator [Clostridia bacterium]
MKGQQSISDVVFERLESDILCGKYQTGDYISENKLATEFGVSRTPVREAVKRLEQEGLIEYANSKAIRVLGITEADVQDVYEIRLSIEGDAFIKASQNMSQEDFLDLEKIIDLQEFYSQKKDAEMVKDADTKFHTKIYEFAKSTVYQTILSQLHNKIQQFRKISQSLGDRSRLSVNEHRAILSAMKAKNFELLEELVKIHVKNARDNILKIKGE